MCCRSPASLPNQVDIRFSVSHTDEVQVGYIGTSEKTGKKPVRMPAT